MKVAMITNYWKNSDGGGVKNYLVNLVDALREIGIKLCVLFREGMDPHEFQGSRNKILFVIDCFRELLKIRPDVIHSHGTWYCLLPGVLYNKIYGCNLIHTFHTEPVKKMPYFGKVFFQYLLNVCDCVTFVSKGLQKRITEIDELTFSRTAITYAGVKAQKIIDEEIKQFRQRFGIKENAIVLLAQAFTAHQLKAEGLKILIKAIGQLIDNYPDILLIATREGKYSEELKQFSREMGLEKHVIFTGDIDNPFIPLNICNIYTHISLGEGGVSIALLEAMSMGKPIIATSVGGIPEAIISEENGLLVKSDPDEIAEKIDFLIQNKDIAEKLGINAKKTVEEKFTWEKASEKFFDLYRTLL